MEPVLLGIIGTLLILLLGYNTRKLSNMNDKLDCVVKDVSEINGSVRELRMWSNMHERQDDERFKDIKKDIGDVKLVVNKSPYSK